MFKAEECFVEENTQYNSNQFPEDGKTYLDNVEECIQHCKTAYGDEAQYYTYNGADAEVCKVVKPHYEPTAG